MNTERFRAAVHEFGKVCDKINKEEKGGLEYVVLQGLKSDDPYLNDSFILHKIAYFYNHNWLGNVDFMHIPDFHQVHYNCNNYPVIIARDKETKEIIGISTLKYEENSEYNEDPYYPIENEKYFSITGILTKMNNPHRGIGKRIYEIALKGHYEFNKIYEDTSIMCVIDCRNKNSLNALHYAAERLNEDTPENMVAKVAGYYILTDDDRTEMLEAPTIVLKVEEEKEREARKTVKFVHPAGEDLFMSLLTTLRDELTDVSDPIINLDEGTGLVSYYHVKNYNSLPKVIPNGTEKGNDRVAHEDVVPAAITRVRNFKR